MGKENEKRKRQVRKAQRTYQAKMRKRRDLLIEALGGKCQARGCGVSDNVCLTFHHAFRYQYLKKISLTIVGMRNSKEKILREAEICILLCHNCHAKVHAGKIKEPKLVKRKLKINGWP